MTDRCTQYALDVVAGVIIEALGFDPVYMGDLKEAITLFDRNVITIDMNDKAAGLWEKDMTGIKVRDRFDVQPVDDGAIIKGNITEVVQG